MVTISGNILVITAIIKTPKLRTKSNYLIMSLSCIDLSVGLIVMPLKTVIDVIYFSEWPFGALFCDIWHILGTVFLSSSDLHLLMIAIDRYLSVTRIGYSLDKSRRNIIYMISFAWTFAIIVALTPILGWKNHQKFIQRIENKVCLASLNISYTIVSAILLFFGPMAIMIPLYYAIYKVFRNTIHFISENEPILQ